MPKVKYDVSNVENSGAFKQAPVALYVLKVAEFNVGESNAGQPMGTIVFEVVKDAKGKKLKEQYGRVWHRIPLEHSDDTAGWTFRLKEFITACGFKEKGAFDTDKVVGTEMLGKLKADKDLDGEYRPAVGKLMPLKDDEDEDEPDEEEVEDDDDDEGDDEDYTADDLKELDDDDLLEVADEFDVKKPKGDLDKKKRKKLIAAILEAQDEADEDEDEEDEDDDDDEEDGDSYDEMSKSQLVKEARSRKIKVKSAHDEDDIRALLRDNDEEEDEDDDDDEDEDESEDEKDYSDWSVQQLKDELKERGLKTSGTQKVLKGRLEKDDEEDDDDGDPF